MSTGFLHPRRVPNAGIKDFVAVKHPLCRLDKNPFSKINDLTRIIMNRKASLRLFKEGQVAAFILLEKKGNPKILFRPVVQDVHVRLWGGRDRDSRWDDGIPWDIGIFMGCFPFSPKMFGILISILIQILIGSFRQGCLHK
jgi:hypothetical protein